jgi:cellulose synthase (UDP-forming)
VASSAASVAWSFFSPYAASEISPADLFNLLWAAVAMAISFSAFLVCFERPRAEECFITNGRIELRCGEQTFSCVLGNASLSFATLKEVPMEAQLAVGDDIEILVPSIGGIRGKVKLDTDGSISVDLLPSPEQRRRLIGYLFTSANEDVAKTARLRPALRGLLRRAFHPERA